jgi:hypothetical protein
MPASYKIQFRSFRLKEWLGMNSSLSSIHAAAKTHAPDVAGKLCEFLAAATDSPVDYWKTSAWWKVKEGLETLIQTNDFEWKVPMIEYGKDEKLEFPKWLYMGREWFYWLHTFASVYHWSEDVIADMKKEDAFALMQEISVERQLQKEWEHSLSEMAYSYNQDAQKSEFHPLERPLWMKGPEKKTVVFPKLKMPKSMLPMGPIQDLAGLSQNIEIVE